MVCQFSVQNIARHQTSELKNDSLV